MPATEALYVLKLRHDRSAWRVTLEELRRGEHWEFASLEMCLNFIAHQHAVTLGEASLPAADGLDALARGDE